MSARAVSGQGRLASVVALLAAAVLGAGCGGDDEGRETGTTAPPPQPPTRTVTGPAETTPSRNEERESTETAPETDADDRRGSSPEDRPGGAGDEEAARAQVVLTGRGGRIGPLLVKVPPFISIRVVLRSADGKPYVLRFGRRVLRAGIERASASATFAGLRPGRRLHGAALSGRVVIEASAEPGP